MADLRPLPADAWETPSLCDEWRVRDVVGHLVRIDEMYERGFPAVADALRAGFRVNKAIADGAIRRASARSPEVLVADLERTAYERRLGPRIYPWPVTLAELIVHGQDIRRPLGLSRAFDHERLAAVAATTVLRIRYPWGRGARFKGCRFEASDANWTWGTGELVRGPLEAIVMVLAGRRIAAADLEGPGVAAIAAG